MHSAIPPLLQTAQEQSSGRDGHSGASGVSQGNKEGALVVRRSSVHAPHSLSKASSGSKMIGTESGTLSILALTQAPCLGGMLIGVPAPSALEHLCLLLRSLWVPSLSAWLCLLYRRPQLWRLWLGSLASECVCVCVCVCVFVSSTGVGIPAASPSLLMCVATPLSSHSSLVAGGGCCASLA